VWKHLKLSGNQTKSMKPVTPTRSISELVELHKLELEVEQNKFNAEPSQKIETFHKILEYKIKLRNISGQVRTLFEIGIIYHQLGENQKAWNYHANLINILDSLNGILIKRKYYQDLRDFYLKNGQNDRAQLLQQRLDNILINS